MSYFSYAPVENQGYFDVPFVQNEYSNHPQERDPEIEFLAESAAENISRTINNNKQNYRIKKQRKIQDARSFSENEGQYLTKKKEYISGNKSGNRSENNNGNRIGNSREHIESFQSSPSPYNQPPYAQDGRWGDTTPQPYAQDGRWGDTTPQPYTQDFYTQVGRWGDTSTQPYAEDFYTQDRRRGDMSTQPYAEDFYTQDGRWGDTSQPQNRNLDPLMKPPPMEQGGYPPSRSIEQGGYPLSRSMEQGGYPLSRSMEQGGYPPSRSIHMPRNRPQTRQAQSMSQTRLPRLPRQARPVPQARKKVILLPCRKNAMNLWNIIYFLIFVIILLAIKIAYDNGFFKQFRK